jgi:phosphate transport system permease protein
VTDLLARPQAARAAPGPAAGASTTVPAHDQAPPAGARKLRNLTAGALDAGGAAVASLCITILLFGKVAAFSGLIGFVVVAYGLFLVAYAVLVSLREDRRTVIDRLMTVLLSTAVALLGIALAGIVGFIVYRGHTALGHANFYTKDLARSGPLAPLTQGGVKHAIVGTLWMITIAMVLTVPLGLVAAVFLNEIGGPLARFVRTIVEAMTALPSIVAGLFIYASFVLVFHQKSAFAAALALSVDMLPIIIRAADVVLRLVPNNLREASSALGAPQWRTVKDVVLPTARSGLATAVILGMARGLGETAPVLLTAGYTMALNTNPFRGPMVSLPLVAFELVASGEPGYKARGYAAAALLLLVVVGLFAIARVIGGRGAGQLSKRQARRAQRRSARDANRFISRYDTAAGTVGGQP